MHLENLNQSYHTNDTNPVVNHRKMFCGGNATGRGLQVNEKKTVVKSLYHIYLAIIEKKTTRAS